MERLKRRTDFRAAAAGMRAPSQTFVLQARLRGDARVARVGFTVSKQIGNAVERNRVRRRLREIVRLARACALRPGHDYVLIGRRAALAAPFAAMRRDLDTALARVHAAGTADRSSLHEAGPAEPPPRRQRPSQELRKDPRKERCKDR
jgi:ribonuclease P protein component